ncbi:MAG: hypothetical protein ACYTG0_06830 [Planctomycetota bacterium]|jgi:hypothetical protein
MSTDVHTTPEVESQGDQDLVALRTRRIQDLSTAALQEESPLRANLLAEAASLMAMGQLLDQAIKRSLANASDVLKQFERVGPAADAHLRYTRLSSRLIELEQRVARSRTGGRGSQLSE